MVAYGGWSAGDIVLAAKFVHRVGNALKESGGAGDDHCQASDFLTGLQQTRVSLDSLKNTVLADETSTDIITSQAQRLAERLMLFIEKVQNDEKTPGQEDRSKG